MTTISLVELASGGPTCAEMAQWLEVAGATAAAMRTPDAIYGLKDGDWVLNDR